MANFDVLFGFAFLLLQSQPAVAPVAPSPEVPLVSPDVAEADIVDGNVVGAKKRALEAAFLNAVERVFSAELADAGLPITGPLPDELAKLRASFPTAARRYIRSYRVVEETEATGKLRVGIDAVVDRAYLRRQIEKTRNTTPTPSGGAVVHVAGAEASPAMAPAVADALRAAGLAVASDSGSPAAFRVALRGQTQLDGDVRGAGLVAARCQVDMTVRRPGGSRDVALPGGAEWGFAAEAPAAEKACLDRLAPLAARAIVPAVHEVQAASSGKPVHVTFDMQEPVALERLLRRLRRVGTISRFELRRIAVGVADVRMETNLNAEALGNTLVASLADELNLTMDQASGDQLRMTMRVRADVAPPLGPDDPIEGQ